jgi:hypothetical protein
LRKLESAQIEAVQMEVDAAQRMKDADEKGAGLESRIKRMEEENAVLQEKIEKLKAKKTPPLDKGKSRLSVTTVYLSTLKSWKSEATRRGVVNSWYIFEDDRDAADGALSTFKIMKQPKGAEVAVDVSGFSSLDDARSFAKENPDAAKVFKEMGGLESSEESAANASEVDLLGDIPSEADPNATLLQDVIDDKLSSKTSSEIMDIVINAATALDEKGLSEQYGDLINKAVDYATAKGKEGVK